MSQERFLQLQVDQSFQRDGKFLHVLRVRDVQRTAADVQQARAHITASGAPPRALAGP